MPYGAGRGEIETAGAGAGTSWGRVALRAGVATGAFAGAVLGLRLKNPPGKIAV